MFGFNAQEWDSPPRRGLANWGNGLGNRNSRAGAYSLITTPYGRRLCRGSGYHFRQPLSTRIWGTTLVFLRIGGLIGLSLALPARAHGPGSQPHGKSAQVLPELTQK